MKPNKGFITVFMMVLISISLSTFSRAAFDTFSDVPNDSPFHESIPLPCHSFLRRASNVSVATLRCFLWRMLTTSLRRTPVIMPVKTSIPDNGAECKSANRG